MAAENILNLKWNGSLTDRSNEIRSHSRFVHALRRVFSFVGHSATKSYACVRLVSRWFCAASDSVKFNRVSSLRDLGAFVGGGGGVRFGGSFPVNVCDRAIVV